MTRRAAGRWAEALSFAVSAAPGLLVALPALPWVWDAVVRASWATLGRDQGIFQYVAWAVAGGARAYRDVRDVNGPLTYLVHTVFQALGGGDEHRFRVLDLVFVSATSVFAGACSPSLEPPLAKARAGIVRAASVGLAAWAVLVAQYVAYGFWDTAQRESFFDGLVLVSVGLQWLAHGRRPRARALLLAGAGAASLAPWLGKPTYALFTAAQIVTLLVEEAGEGEGDGDGRFARLRRLAIFAAGGALGAAVPLAFLVTHGDVAAWARITFVDVPAMYRFIWPRPPLDVLLMYRGPTALGLVTSLAMLALVVTRRLPRRALPIALFPLAGLASAVIQAKAFPYHFHPATAFASLALVVLVQHAWARAEATKRVTRVVLAAALAIAVGGRAAFYASSAPYPEVPDAAARANGDWLAPYERVDFFPVALREAASDLRRHTRADDTVQLYGMDPYLLYLAERRSATPYIYAYDLNADAALHGSWEPDGVHPTDEQKRRIQAMRDEHEKDMLARLEQSPPAAFVFVDRSPLMAYAGALDDFEAHCPDAAPWVLLRYRETSNHDGIRVWLRRDLAAAADAGE